jgi:hypothetical protein
MCVAQYEDDMERAYRTNPGLAGRFKKEKVVFTDWTTAMGAEAFARLARAEGWALEDVVPAELAAALEGGAGDRPPVLQAVWDNVRAMKGRPDFANGRTIDAFVRQAYNSRCQRLHRQKAEEKKAAAGAATSKTPAASERAGIQALKAAGAAGLAGKEPITSADVWEAADRVIKSLLGGSSAGAGGSRRGYTTSLERNRNRGPIDENFNFEGRGPAGVGGGAAPPAKEQFRRETERERAVERAAPAPAAGAVVAPDGADWWTAAMADLARRLGKAVTAADMLSMCSSGSFDAAFFAFVGTALGIAPPQAAERVRSEAAAQLPTLRKILEKESAALAKKQALDTQGVMLVALWVCGYCGNSNPGCPYRATKSGGYFIYVPISMAVGPLCSQGVADLDVKARAGFADFRLDQ